LHLQLLSSRLNGHIQSTVNNQTTLQKLYKGHELS